MNKSCFNKFRNSIEDISLPDKFTFPFYYDAHPLSIIASQELQDYLLNQNDFEHNFGLDETIQGQVIGKMFGVLVVQNKQNELGFLVAFSGKLAGSNTHKFFVPALFDMLQENGFYLKGEEINYSVNAKVDLLLANPNFKKSKIELDTDINYSKDFIAKEKIRLKENKRQRKMVRENEIAKLSNQAYDSLLEKLKNESLEDHFYLTNLIKYWKFRVFNSKLKHERFVDELSRLKKERKERSIELQNQLFDSYNFLNAEGEERSLRSIFFDTAQKFPPSGAGECAAPKLLQYAFANNLKPISLAEFWWGASPKSEIRKNGQFYPSCKAKCEPILGHMLKGLEMDENPLLKNPAEGKNLSIVFEDESIILVNKPPEFLSVPGKTISDSVLTRLIKLYPNATGPILVHRIDMSTSGILLATKTKEAHQFLQNQFIKRTIKKRYVALLDGNVLEDEGIIDLPVRLDIDNRPNQLICFEHGKPAQTKWQVIERSNGKTKVHFFPITGRTHQLRVHAAHHLGLNSPICGDDLYGSKSNRLYLHAEFISFVHPITRKNTEFTVKADF